MKQTIILVVVFLIFATQTTVYCSKGKNYSLRAMQEELDADTKKIHFLSKIISQENYAITLIKETIQETADNALKTLLQNELEVTLIGAQLTQLSLDHAHIMKEATIEIYALGKIINKQNSITLSSATQSDNLFFARMNTKIEPLYNIIKKKFEDAIAIQKQKKLILQKAHSLNPVKNYQETIRDIDALIKDHEISIVDLTHFIKNKVVNNAGAHVENHIQKKEAKLEQELLDKKKIESAQIKKTKKIQTLAAAQQAFNLHNNQVLSVLASTPPVTLNPDASMLQIKITQEEILGEQAEKEQEIQRLNTQAAQEKAIRNQLRAAHNATIATPNNMQDVKSMAEKQPSNTAQPMFAITSHEHFNQWHLNLDQTSQVAINQRIKRLQEGDFGDAHKIKNSASLWELRIKSTNPQSRVYYDCRDNHIHILCGGKKAKQQQNIQLALSLVKKLKAIPNIAASK